MKRLIFWWRCRKIMFHLTKDWYIHGRTHALCTLTYRFFDVYAKIMLMVEFRNESPYPSDDLWLGSTSSKEGYENRKLYLKKFYKRAIETGKYKEFV